MQRNPPWADKIMYANWKQIATFAKKNGLPAPTPNLPPSRKISWREFGCGKWGCAYPTEDPAVVCKLTADMSEAVATVGLAALQGKPGMDGIVQYYGIMPLRGRHAAQGESPTSITLIWREGADCGETLRVQSASAKGKRKLDMDASWQLLYNALVAADVARQIHDATRNLKAFVQQVNQVLPEARQETIKDQHSLLALQGYDFDKWDTTLTYMDGPDGFAYCVAAFELICHAIIKIGILDRVAQTLLTCLQNGILLADVHDENICEINRPNGRYWVIIDPGQAVVIGQRAKYKQLVKTTSWQVKRKGCLASSP